MPKFLLFYQLEYLHHNYSIQYLKLVSFFIGTKPPDSVITCLCEFWQSAIKQCYLQKEKSCLSVCLCIPYARKQKIFYIFSCQADMLTACFEVWAWKKKTTLQLGRDKYFKTSCFFQVLLEVDLFFSWKWHLHRGWQKPSSDTWGVNAHPIVHFYLWSLGLSQVSINVVIFALACVFSTFKRLSKTWSGRPRPPFFFSIGGT